MTSPSQQNNNPLIRSPNEMRRELISIAGLAVVILAVIVAAYAAWAAHIHDRPGVSSGASSANAQKAAPDTATANADSSAPVTSAASGKFSPPADTDIPDTPMGKVIRQGEQIFLNTRVNAPQFTGNKLRCASCHLDAGRLADASPMWGAYTQYPAYRTKTDHVDTFAERVRGCFMYSLNGTAPPDGDDVLVAIEAYAYWMATGAPTGERLPGTGFLRLDAPEQKADTGRGHKVYDKHCAVCHGANGEGQHAGDTQVFPPLWGPESYNWGAGMARLHNASGFIKANMPLGHGGTLTDQEAWDVAIFMDSHERPQDPRFTGDVAETRKEFHDSDTSLYGTEVDGKVLGTNAY